MCYPGFQTPLHSPPLPPAHIHTADKCTLTCSFIQLWWLCYFIVSTHIFFCIYRIMCPALSTLLKDSGLNADLQQFFGRQKDCPATPSPPERRYLFWWWSLFLWYPEIRNQLVEQFRCLEQQSESRLQLLQDLQDFFRRKAELQLEYSRGLDKLAERYSAKIRTSREHQHLKWVHSFCVRSSIFLTDKPDIYIYIFFTLITAAAADRWKQQRGRKTEEWSNRNKKRDKSRRNDLKCSQGQGSSWPQAAVFLPTRSGSLSKPPTPPPHTLTTALAPLCGCHFIFILKQLHARLPPKHSQEYRGAKTDVAHHF